VSVIQSGTPSPPSADTPMVVTVIRARPGWVPLDLRELWAYRELLAMLTRRDLTTRYKQTVLGVLWAVLQPVFTMIIFSILFGRIARFTIPGMENQYPLFLFAGLVPWTFFSLALGKASNSLVGNSFLLKKVYFPRFIIPMSSTLAPLVDLLIAFGVLLGLTFYYGRTPQAAIIYLPFFVMLTYIFALGMGLWLSALNVQFRDVQHVIPFIIQILMYGSPIVYTSEIVSKSQWFDIYMLNPLAHVVEGFRWCLFHDSYAKVYSPDLSTVWASLIAVGTLVSGAYVFRRMEKTFADIV
jgi:lipopolysaccharide transport system permease protein